MGCGDPQQPYFQTVCALTGCEARTNGEGRADSRIRMPSGSRSLALAEVGNAG